MTELFITKLLFSSNGIILILISLLALFIYWHIFDLLQQVCTKVQYRDVVTIRQSLLRTQQLSSWLNVLPLLGLLGTVGGLFDSFSGMATGNQQTLTGGISEALLTTQLGLSTALPALLMVTVCRRRCENLLQEALCAEHQ